jgi:beta-lactamase class A
MSCGSAAELSLLMSTLATGSMARPGIAPRVTAWLRLNMDLSMVGGALDLDPLSHRHATTGIALFNKTGSDAGVRADTGSVQSSDATVSYAVIANWPPSEVDATHDVLAGMRRIGFGLRDHLTAMGKRRRTHHGVV